LAEKLSVIVRAPRRYQGSFPCSPIGARQARCAVRTFVRAWLSGRDLNDFEAAIGEVLANAVEHSRGEKIAIECYFEAGKVIAEIRDRGCGFPTPAAIEAPQDGALRGYGLFIVHRLLDEVEYLDGGRMLRLVKARSESS
jgi:anti-sigma regulatory factor (Ser/Thr protein kinase)